MPPPVGWLNPIVASPGQRQVGVDPNRLLPARADLDRNRLAAQAALLNAGTTRHTPVQVTANGVIYDGHHAVRAAAECGALLDVLVVDDPTPAAADSIMDLPVY
jgi:hypothetical protein